MWRLIKTIRLSTRWEGDLLDGVMVIDAQGQFVDIEAWRGHLYRPALPLFRKLPTQPV